MYVAKYVLQSKTKSKAQNRAPFRKSANAFTFDGYLKLAAWRGYAHISSLLSCIVALLKVPPVEV